MSYLFCVLISFSAIAYGSQEEVPEVIPEEVPEVMSEELPEADLELIAVFKQMCSEVAEYEEISGSALHAFLLGCVNKELEIEGYRLITKLN